MKKNILVIIAVIALLIIAGAVYYWTRSYTTDTASVAAVGATTGVPVSEVVSEAEIKKMVNKLQKHLLLPVGETPQILQIDDPVLAVEKQPFLDGVKKGDLLIIYSKALKAIVYSPSRDLIINVGPVSVNPDQVVEQAPDSDQNPILDSSETKEDTTEGATEE